MISLFGLVADPQFVAERLRMLTRPLPAGAAEMVSDVLEQVTVRTGGGHLGLGSGLAAAALWSAMAAASQLFGALNVVYKVPEKRGFLRLNLDALLFACAAAIFILLALSAIVAVPIMLSFTAGISSRMPLLLFLRWPALLVAVSVALALTYRFGPSRVCPQWRWVSWGSAAAAVTWLLGSVAVSSYFNYIGSYNWLYGSFGAVLGFMIWAWVSTTAVLFGAALNAEIEHWRPVAHPQRAAMPDVRPEANDID